MKIASILIPIILVTLFGVFMFLSLKTDPYVHNEAKNVKTIQGVDVPIGLPKENASAILYEEKLDVLSPFTRVQIPVAYHFDQPMGSRNGAFAYNAQTFLERNSDYAGKKHLGDDLNGIGGQNSDLNDPIYAAADGLVVYSGKPSEGWGNVVVLAHKLTDGRIIQTFYSHLQAIFVAEGSQVGRGTLLGTCGNADGRYWAHLHYEMRESDGVVVGAGYADTAGEKIDPTEFVKKYNKLSEDKITKSVQQHILETERNKLFQKLRKAE